MNDTATKKPARAKTVPTVCSPLWAKNPNSAKLPENRAKIIPTGKHMLQPITINLIVGGQAAKSAWHKVVGSVMLSLKVHPSCFRREENVSALPLPFQLAFGKGRVMYA